MTLLTNLTPFSASQLSVFDHRLRQMHVVIVSATFNSHDHAPLDIAAEQLPVHEVDVHAGDPARSSVVYEGEVAWHKPHVDVVVNGAAYAPRGRKTASVEATLELGGLRKVLRVSGDRSWRQTPLGKTPGAPEPFERMPIVYERAFGGCAPESDGPADVRNLVGVGFRGARSAAQDVHTEVPNVEDPRRPVTGPGDDASPAGFGVVSRGWQPRRGHAGTFGESWLASRAPLLPEDFDPMHFQCAPADQRLRSLVGGEAGRLLNMTPDGSWSFVLPSLLFPIHFRWLDRVERVGFVVDTVVLEPDVRRLALIGRATVPLRRNHPPLAEIIVGDVSPGWLRSRRRGKPYWGRFSDGGCAHRQDYML